MCKSEAGKLFCLKVGVGAEKTNRIQWGQKQETHTESKETPQVFCSSWLSRETREKKLNFAPSVKYLQ